MDELSTGKGKKPNAWIVCDRPRSSQGLVKGLNLRPALIAMAHLLLLTARTIDAVTPVPRTLTQHHKKLKLDK